MHHRSEEDVFCPLLRGVEAKVLPFDFCRKQHDFHEDQFLQDAWLKGEVDTGDDVEAREETS